MKPLQDRIAIVTGGSRGAGRGIAVELGAAGATVYVTGRTTRDAQPKGYAKYLHNAGLAAMPGTIEDTADAVTAAGGRGIAVPCDHTDEEQVAASGGARPARCGTTRRAGQQRLGRP